MLVERWTRGFWLAGGTGGHTVAARKITQKNNVSYSKFIFVFKFKNKLQRKKSKGVTKLQKKLLISVDMYVRKFMRHVDKFDKKSTGDRGNKVNQ